MIGTGKQQAVTAESIQGAIHAYAAGGENRLRPEGNESAWEDPLVGFSRGDDPLYEQMKEDIGDFLWTPAEIFNATFPGQPASAEELTVISWILPQTRQTREEHREAKNVPADRWALSRQYGEVFNTRLRDHLTAWLAETGHQAVAPQNSALWSRERSDRYGLASSWSERHAAHVSGLGTFGLCDGLITAKGKAVRCGSVVVRLAVPVTPRPYRGHHDDCLFFQDSSCGRCMARCPAAAITPTWHDKGKCSRYLQEVTIPFIRGRFGFTVTACGFCQVGVPCEAARPRHATGASLSLP